MGWIVLYLLGLLPLALGLWLAGLALAAVLSGLSWLLNLDRPKPWRPSPKRNGREELQALREEWREQRRRQPEAVDRSEGEGVFDAFANRVEATIRRIPVSELVAERARIQAEAAARRARSAAETSRAALARRAHGRI